MPAAAEPGRWEGQDRLGRSIEIDIVAELTNRKMLTGQVKWSSAPIGPGVHYRLMRNVEDIASCIGSGLG